MHFSRIFCPLLSLDYQHRTFYCIVFTFLCNIFINSWRSPYIYAVYFAHSTPTPPLTPSESLPTSTGFLTSCLLLNALFNLNFICCCISHRVQSEMLIYSCKALHTTRLTYQESHPSRRLEL